MIRATSIRSKHGPFSLVDGRRDYLTYGGKWISTRQSNGEFDYYFVIEILNWKEAVGEREAPPETYNVSLSVVSPQEAGQENCRKATDCCGIEEDMLARAIDHGQCEEILVEALHGYGLSVPVWSKDGNNHKELMRQARGEAQIAAGLFGFVMDRPVNRIGVTGWEHLRGDMQSAV